MEIGPAESPAALFIFKDDDKNQVAWDDASAIPYARVELHRKRSAFLDALRAWNLRIEDSTNSFLLVYAHGARNGIATRADGTELVTWAKLRDALPNGVATLWLVGCLTQNVKSHWPTPKASPVTSSLLVTTATLNWLNLIALFRAETDINSIVFFDQMKSYLLRSEAKLGSQVEYLDAIGAEWAPFAETSYIEPSSGYKLTREEIQTLQSIWGIPGDTVGCGHVAETLLKSTATLYRYNCSICHLSLRCSRSDEGPEVVAYCSNCSENFRDKKRAVRSVKTVELFGCPECLCTRKGDEVGTLPLAKGDTAPAPSDE